MPSTEGELQHHVLSLASASHCGVEGMRGALQGGEIEREASRSDQEAAGSLGGCSADLCGRA